jgi:hypothetical protein
MKYSFKVPLGKELCFDILKNKADVVLSTGKFFRGERKGDQFEFNYSMEYTETASTVGSTHKRRILPYCTVIGKITEEKFCSLIEGSVVMARVRAIIVSIIFLVVFIALETFLISIKGPYIETGIFLLLAFGAFFFSEFMRFLPTRKEAAREFEKLFK